MDIVLFIIHVIKHIGRVKDSMLASSAVDREI